MSMHDNPIEVLPHRPPFLFIDRVLSCDSTHVRAMRRFRPDEDFFRGHFPGNPIVPGVLLLEGMAQTMAYLANCLPDVKAVYLVGIDKAHFRKPVRPGDEVEFSVTLEGQRLGMFIAAAEAHVDGIKVADARLSGVTE